MTSLRFAVGTIIGPNGVRVASELIIGVSAAAAAAKVQSEVGCGFKILMDSFGSSEMAGERAKLYWQSAATANEISGRVASAAYINEPMMAW